MAWGARFWKAQQAECPERRVRAFPLGLPGCLAGMGQACLPDLLAGPGRGQVRGARRLEGSVTGGRRRLS